MIAFLRGALVERSPKGEVVIDVAGVGYQLAIPSSTGARLPSLGAEVFLHVHHHFREDAQALFGFLDRSERDCFETLLATHGVGPALALAILSIHSPTELVRLLVEEDVAALCQVPGVGKKTAARLLVELRNRLDLTSFAPPVSAAPRVGMEVTGVSLVRRALGELGYGPEEVRHALDGLDDDGDESAMLRRALQKLATGR